MCSEENSDWTQDANIVIRDIKNHVHYISIANLPSSECKIYFNITTLEMKEFCVELSVAGFQIIGEKHDSDDKRGKYSVHETPYSLLDSLSPGYRASFGEQLIAKLSQLPKK